MTEKLILLVLWALAIGGVVFAFLNQSSPGRSSVARPPTIGGWRSVVGIFGAALFMLLLTGCGMWTDKAVYGSIPDCSRLVPKTLIEPVTGVAIPIPEVHADGHDKAQPWIEGYIGQTGQLDKANENAPAVDHIYKTCETMHREALDKAKHGWFRRLFD